jgi:hypothetical protein
MPRIAGDWWTVAGNPDLGDLTSPKQQPVDFSIWQAADGTWQLWSCIRNTRIPGATLDINPSPPIHLEKDFNPTCRRSIGLKPIFKAGEPGLSRTSPARSRAVSRGRRIVAYRASHGPAKLCLVEIDEAT